MLESLGRIDWDKSHLLSVRSFERILVDMGAEDKQRLNMNVVRATNQSRYLLQRKPSLSLLENSKKNESRPRLFF